MGAGKQTELTLQTPQDFINNDPIKQFQTKFKELENGFKGWLAKQSLPVEAAVVTITSAAQGAAIGGIMGTLTSDAASTFPAAPPPAASPQAMASFQQAQALAGGPFIQARNFAVMTGVNAGISCVMKRLRGKEDVQTSMVAAFGSGVMFSLVSGMGGPNPAANVITSGVFFALVQGGLFKVGEKFSKPPAEDVLYSDPYITHPLPTFPHPFSAASPPYHHRTTTVTIPHSLTNSHPSNIQPFLPISKPFKSCTYCINNLYARFAQAIKPFKGFFQDSLNHSFSVLNAVNLA